MSVMLLLCFVTRSKYLKPNFKILSPLNFGAARQWLPNIVRAEIILTFPNPGNGSTPLLLGYFGQTELLFLTFLTWPLTEKNSFAFFAILQISSSQVWSTKRAQLVNLGDNYKAGAAKLEGKYFWTRDLFCCYYCCCCCCCQSFPSLFFLFGIVPCSKP